MTRRRSGYVKIDVCDIIHEIADELLVDEVQSRKLIIGSQSPDFVPEDDLREAYEELLRGRSSEALAILNRLLFPKWKDVKSSEAEYLRAKTRQ